jgi:hypothetical protein
MPRKPSKVANPAPYVVIRDTREKQGQGWIFAESPRCGGTVIQTMKTGDYTLQGFENVIVIERKKSTSEFCQNILEARFDAELVRMESFPLPFMILEFTMDDVMRWPIGSGIPKYKLKYVKVTKYFLLKRLADYQVQYKTKIIFAGIHGKEMAASLFKRVNEGSSYHVKG